MSNNDRLKEAATGVTVSPASNLSTFLKKNKAQIDAALGGSHLNSDRMIRLAMTAFSSNASLQDCTPVSILGSVITAAQLGLEIGVTGQAYLVPYKGKATFVPGWQGLVDLVSRSGRGTVWTGAVFPDDHFEFDMGDRPFIHYRKGRGKRTPAELICTFAVGWVKGAEYPVIDVWWDEQLKDHRDKYNKVGSRHYSYENWEMYARKIPLLQVIKYMPKSVQLAQALEADNDAEQGTGSGFVFEGSATRTEGGDGGGGGAGDDDGRDRREEDKGAGKPSGAREGQERSAPDTTKGAPTEQRKEPQGPTVEDAMRLAGKGQFDDARDMARGIGPDAVAKVEATIKSRQNQRSRGNGFEMD